MIIIQTFCRHRSCLTLWLLVLQLVLPRSGWTSQPDACDNEPQCSAYKVKGTTLAQAHRNKEALEQYDCAYRRQATNRLLMSRGRMHYQLGEYCRARALLDNVPQSQLSPEEQRTFSIYLGDTLSKSPGPCPALLTELVPPSNQFCADPLRPDHGHRESGSSTPLRKRWWLWTLVGVGAASVIAVGAVLGSRHEPVVSSTWLLN